MRLFTTFKNLLHEIKLTLNILQVYKDYYPPVMGGIEGHLNLLSTHMVSRGHNVDVLVSNDKPRLKNENIDGVNVTRAPQLGRFFSAPLNYSIPYLIGKLGKNYDLLHFHLPNPTATIGHQLSGLKKPYLVSYHADITRQKRLNWFYEYSLKRFLQRSNRIIATSENYICTSPLLRLFKYKCKAIPLGIDLSRFKIEPKIDQQIKIIQSRYDLPTILFVGRFRHYKGLSTLIKAMRTVPAILLLIGKGPLEIELKDQAMKAGIMHKIKFLGELSDSEVNAHFHACDVFTLPATQRSEAFGIVQLEAMACGKPIVSTELGTGTSYVNRHGETGLVVAPNDATALAKALSELIASPDKCESLGESGRIRVSKLFCIDQMVESILITYQEALK